MLKYKYKETTDMKVNKDYRKLRALPLIIQFVIVTAIWVYYKIDDIWVYITRPYRWLKLKVQGSDVGSFWELYKD